MRHSQALPSRLRVVTLSDAVCAGPHGVVVGGVGFRPAAGGLERCGGVRRLRGGGGGAAGVGAFGAVDVVAGASDAVGVAGDGAAGGSGDRGDRGVAHAASGSGSC